MGVICVALAITGSNSGAGQPVPSLLDPPLSAVSNKSGPSVSASRGVGPLQSLNGQDYSRLAHRFLHLDLTHGKNNPDAPGVTTIPHWSDSFTYNGLVYKYTMVGTDPKRGSATTVIPTVLIPIRFVFADGNVFDATTDIVDGQTPIQGIINSPLFQNYDFNHNAGTYVYDTPAPLVKVGNTQYGDAFQRANFWDSVSTRSPNYHVLLGQPTVLPVQTINVPNGSFGYFIDPVTGPQPEVDPYLLFNIVEPILNAAHLSATTLPIIVWGRVNGFGVGGFHGHRNLDGINLQTFIATEYLPGFSVQIDNQSYIVEQDVYALSHEILEWMNDPFENNFTPGWDEFFFATPTPTRCDSGFIARDLLEVGDVVEFFADSQITLPASSHSYHVTEGAFVDFFTRSSRSRSYNGQYSFFEMGLPYGIETSPSPVCTGHVEFTPTYVDYPGATFTDVLGLNNQGSAVGFYYDNAGRQHGFVFNGSSYLNLDYPGSVQTLASKINDGGTVVGWFTDSANLTHGFSYAKGKWSQLDFPGASDTEVYGINSSGVMVGVYDGAQPITHGFLLQNGKYQDIPNPFGAQTNAFAINDPGLITGVGYTDSAVGPFASFILSKEGFSAFEFPGSVFSNLQSINNGGDLAGYFEDPDGSFWGMVTVNGVPYQVFSILAGNNDLQQICGNTFDSSGQLHGFVGTLPLQRNAR